MSWMAYGGILRVEIAATGGLPPYGIHVQVQRGLAP